MSSTAYALQMRAQVENEGIESTPRISFCWREIMFFHINDVPIWQWIKIKFNSFDVSTSMRRNGKRRCHRISLSTFIFALKFLPKESKLDDPRLFYLSAFLLDWATSEFSKRCEKRWTKTCGQWRLSDRFRNLFIQCDQMKWKFSS